MNKPSIKNIQSKLLEIAIDFDFFCKKHKIVYYLMGGSALGAVRHMGFIPWDDDYDVFMDFENYTKFLKISEKKLNVKKYYLQKENTEEWPMFFSKVRLNGTTFIEEDTKNKKMHKGMFIDIMCLNNTSSNILYRYIQYICARLITIKTLSKKGYYSNSLRKKASIYFFSKIINYRVLLFLLNIVRSLNNKDVKYVGHFFGRAKFKNTSFLKEYLGKQRYVRFSSTFLPVPNKVEQYLEVRYGKNFMKIPDEKTKSLYPSHASFVDLNNDYKLYEKNSNNE